MLLLKSKIESSKDVLEKIAKNGKLWPEFGSRKHVALMKIAKNKERPHFILMPFPPRLRQWSDDWSWGMYYAALRDHKELVQFITSEGASVPIIDGVVSVKNISETTPETTPETTTTTKTTIKIKTD